MAVAATAVCGNKQSPGRRVALLAQLLPPIANCFDREFRRIVTSSDGDPCVVLMNIVCIGQAGSVKQELANCLALFSTGLKTD